MNEQASSDLIHGTLDLLILNTISLVAAWMGIAKRIEQVSRDALQISQGPLSALHRLDRGWFDRSGGRTVADAKFYT